VLQNSCREWKIKKLEEEISLLKGSNDDLVAMVTRGALTVNPNFVEHQVCTGKAKHAAFLSTLLTLSLVRWVLL